MAHSKQSAPRSGHHSHHRPVTAALDWLSTDPVSGSVLAQAKRLQILQNHVDEWSANHHLRLMVVNEQTQILKLLTSHPAMLSRIRQHIPGLINFLQQRGWSINGIEPKVQSRALVLTSVKYPKQAVFSATARREWLSLNASLYNECLKKATQALCVNHGLGGNI